MKTTSFLTVLIVLIGTVTFAQELTGPRMAVISQKDPSTFKLIYEGEKAGKVRLVIRNAEDRIVFAETTKNVGGFIRRINFAGMEYGTYTIEVADQAGTHSNTVEYTTRKTIKNVHVSKMSENGKYLLAVSKNGTETINVKIFDGAYNLVHSANTTVDGDFGVVYNLLGVNGVPTFEISDNQGNVSKIK